MKIKKTNKKVEKNKIKSPYEEIKAGVVAVDSGSILITDPCYIDAEWVNEEESTKPKNNFSYPTCCEKTLGGSFGQLNFKVGHPGVGVVTTSGYGDGTYPVFVKVEKESGRVKEIRVEFF